MAAYKKLSGSRVQFSLEITQEDLEKAEPKALEFLRQHVSLKGFRKGRIPDAVLRNMISSDQILVESATRAIDDKFKAFTKEHELRVISNPKADGFNPQKLPCKVQIEVEVYPEVNVDGYKKVKMPAIKGEVKDEEIEAVIENLIAQQGKGKEVERSAKNGDQVIVDFTGTDKEGTVLKNTEAKEVKVRLGQGHFIPEFEAMIVGMKKGDKKEKEKVKFPKDYSAKELAGNEVFFDVSCHSVQEISPAALNDKDAKEIFGKESVEEMRKDIRSIITENKEKQARKEAYEKYRSDLAKAVKIELPPTWIVREVEHRLHQFKENPRFKANPQAFWKEFGKDEETLKKEFETFVAQDLTIFLSLSEIVKLENIELDKDEITRAMSVVDEKIKNNQLPQAHKNAEIERIELNMKIDKYLKSLTL